jgi:hypothetical protein
MLAAVCGVNSLMRFELIQLFKSYQEGWDSLCGDKIASHYRTPTSIMDSDGLRNYLGLEELASKFESNCASFKAMGYRGAEFSVGHFIENGEYAATIDLGWRVSIESGVRDFRTTYVCVFEKGRWRILSAIAYEGPYNEGDN